MNKLNIKEFSVEMTEEGYHEYPNVSYSDINKYLNEGFSCIRNLREHKDSESFLQGSIIDTFITEPELFFNKYMISSDDKLSGKIVDIFKFLINLGYTEYKNIPNEVKIDAARQYKYRDSFKDNTIVKYLDEHIDSYNKMVESYGKTLITEDQYNMAIKCKESLSNNVLLNFATFGNNDIEVHYQLKFFTDVYGVPYKIMPDIIHVDHNNKIVRIYDLKSTRHSAVDFPKSYIDYNYWVQQWLYTSILRQIIHSAGYVEYNIVWGGFIVVSKKDYTSLLWNFDDINKCSILKLGEYVDEEHNIHWRNPFSIGEEIYTYSTNQDKYPDWIDEFDSNNIKTYFDYNNLNLK